MMKIVFSILILICFQEIFSQNNLEGIIVDDKTLLPIEFVDVYSNLEYTSTNADGRYKITSKNDSISFRRLGYNEIHSTFQELKHQDTIRLLKIEYALEEVIIKDKVTVLKDVFSEIKNNYPYKPYKEKFFLRVGLWKNGKMVKLQDLYGKLKRQSLFGVKNPKKNYEIELLNMRKAGFEEKKYDVVFWSFNQLLSELTTIGIKPGFFYLKKKPYKKDFYKMEFSSKGGTMLNDYSGYYVINSNDNSILEFYSNRIIKNSKYKNRFGIIKFRTTHIERFITFKKSEIANKYYVSKFKENIILEVLIKKEVKPIVYKYSYILTTNDNFGTFNVNKNISSNKDIFKLKHKHKKSFWDNQKQLLLTKDMQKFIKKVKGNEFKAKTNLN